MPSASRIVRAGNPLWPLPPDYGDLTREGQRQARVNGCRQWTIDGTPSEKGVALAGSINFFDRWYLWPDPDEDFNPLFYDMQPIEPPAGHFAVYRLWGSSPRSVAIAPRGFAKTSAVRKASILQMLSCVDMSYKITYATSSGTNAEETASAIMTQFRGNQRIHDDFSPEFPGGRIVPSRGERPFGVEMMYLTNGSYFRAVSAEGRLRGGRPTVFMLDDPEYEGRASTNMALMRSYMENLLIKLVLPMVMRKDTGVRWLATFVSRRHYAWHAMATQPSPTGPVAVDPRFDYWSRMVLKAEYEDAHGVRRSAWPDMWPIDIATKNADPSARGKVSLEEIRLLVGSRTYEAEYLANPGASDDVHFGELTRERHGWWFRDPDASVDLLPRESHSTICFHDKQGAVVEMPLHRFLEERVRLFITVDTSYTSNTDSDFKVCTLMGYDPLDSSLFVLDTWGAQCREDRLIKECFQMADRWGCPLVFVEVVRESFGLYVAMNSLVMQRTEEMVGSSPPRVLPLRPGKQDKTSKINALHYRFEHGLVKLPLSRRGQSPWRHLFEQIEQFNPDAQDGGLQHDDFLDTVAMSTPVVRGRLERSLPREEGPEVVDVEALVREGRWGEEHGGVELSRLVNLQQVPLDAVLQGMRARMLPMKEGTRA